MSEGLRSSPYQQPGPIGNVLSGPLAGALYPLRALALLWRTPRLWKYVALPVLVNLVVGLTLYATLLVAGWQAIGALLAGLPEWAVVVQWLLGALLVVGLLLGTGYVLVRFGVVLGAPWYGRLSAEVERMVTGREPPEGAAGISGTAQELGRALLYELKKLTLFLSVFLPSLLLNLIPVAGTIFATIAQITLGATITCLDFFDSPLERRHMRFRDKLAVVRRTLPTSSGFGLVCLGLVSIPFVNLLAIPVCMVAGTLFVCEQVVRDA